MTRLIVASVIVAISFSASAADKPLPVTVANTVVPVEVRNADPIPVIASVGGQLTHMGVKASDHVTIVFGGVGGSTCPSGMGTAIRQSLDGFPSGQFLVPSGKAFVLTDMSIWISAAAGVAWNIGDNVEFRIYGGDSIFPNWQKKIFVDQVASNARAIWFTESVNSGVIFGPGRICAEAPNVNSVLFNSSKVYGYLVDYTPNP